MDGNKVVYVYSRATGELIGTSCADPDPLEAGNWLIPAWATDQVPPNPERGFVAQYLPESLEWVVIEDYRGTVYDISSGAEIQWNKLGPLPETVTNLPCPGAFHVWAEGRWELDSAAYSNFAEQSERAWRDATLQGISWLRERHRDEQDLQMPTTLTAPQFSSLLGYLQQLRDWPQSDRFPDLDQRPVAPPWIAEQSQ